MSLLLAAGSTPPVVEIRLPRLLIVRAEDLAVYEWTDSTRVLRPGFVGSLIQGQRLPRILLAPSFAIHEDEFAIRSSVLRPGFVGSLIQRLPRILLTPSFAIHEAELDLRSRILTPGFKSGVQRLPGLLISTDRSDQFPELDRRSAFLEPGFVSGVQRLPALVYAQRWVDEPDPNTEIRSTLLSFGSFVATPDIPNTRYWLLYGIAYDGYVYEDLVGNYRSVVLIPVSDAQPPVPPAGIIWKPLFARGGRGRLGR